MTPAACPERMHRQGLKCRILDHSCSAAALPGEDAPDEDLISEVATVGSESVAGTKRCPEECQAEGYHKHPECGGQCSWENRHPDPTIHICFKCAEYSGNIPRGDNDEGDHLCEYCEMWVKGGAIWLDHLIGKKHKKNTPGYQEEQRARRARKKAERSGFHPSLLEDTVVTQSLQDVPLGVQEELRARRLLLQAKKISEEPEVHPILLEDTVVTQSLQDSHLLGYPSVTSPIHDFGEGKKLGKGVE